jgi:bifunctional non-homologous end joining protein LigD
LTGNNQVVQVDERRLKLSNLDKILWPEEKITKAEVIKYYAEVGSCMIPFVKDRPLMAIRYPNGIKGKSFVQKHFTGPRWVKRPHTKLAKLGDFVLCNDLPTLVWLANLAALEINQMLSRSPNIFKHDIVLIDLDPHPPATFSDARMVASGLARVLEYLRLDFLVKTSGAEGIHFFIPIEPRYSVEKIRRFVYAIGKLVEKADPKLATVSTEHTKKSGRVYIDFLQNALEKTITAPFSIRPLASAPVSFPLSMEELDDPKLNPNKFTVRTVARKMKTARRNLYLSELRQDLKPALKRLGIKT